MIYYECGICEALHPWEWSGDCREDAARYFLDTIKDDDEVRSMDERVEADARGERHREHTREGYAESGYVKRLDVWAELPHWGLVGSP